MTTPPPSSLLLLFLVPLLLTPHHVAATTSSNTPYRPSPRAPVVMLSTMDGTLSVFDARNGATLFTHRDTRPAVDSWAAPGVPDYIPSLDGALYRIDRTTGEAHIIHGKFISGQEASTSVPLSTSDHADAVILTDEKSSVILIDLRTGRVVSNFRFSDKSTDPGIPALTEHVIAISRTSVGVRVVEVGTRKELANASLIHNEPFYLGSNQRCLPRHDTNPDAFVAYMAESRDKLFVKSLQTGEILWSKDVSSSVVEAHGLGGVRIVANRRDAELVGGTERALPDRPAEDSAYADGADLFVAKEGKRMYAMLAAPADSEDTENSSTGTPQLDSERKRKKIRKFHIANVRDPTILHGIDRRFGLGRLPLHRDKFRASTNGNDNYNGLAARDAGWVLIALVIVGFVGYIVGSRPRHAAIRSQSKKKVKRRKRTAAGMEVEELLGEPEADVHDDDDNTDSGLEDNSLVTGIMARGVASTDQNGNPPQDPLIEVSNGSSGSLTGGGYLSNRTENGWMTVGCLQVSSKVLGVGSHGTVVYEGKMVPGERKVAVKRLLRQFYESARKEISLLVELDEASPHVVRYFAMEEDSEFIYLALELCAGSLAERATEKLPPVPPPTYVCGPPPADTSQALRQLIQGLADLHRVGVVHRDVKPQNVLITRTVTGSGDVKLADVGLALRLAANRSSYTAVTNAGGGVGTTGWRAPEVLSGGRQTKAVDIFAAGCVVSYVLTKGEHPFGNAIFGRDGNIVAGRPSLDALEALHLPEATDIVKKMIDPVASNRPTAEEALRHPFFWTDATKLSFLVDISDRLYDLRHDGVRYTENLDRYALARENCSDWLVRMDMDLLMGLGRQYENTASGLLRVIRNKRNHYSELSASLRKRLGPLPEDKIRSANGPEGSHRSEKVDEPSDVGRNFLTYFTSRVPHLLICVYQYAIENPALIDQPHFHRYGLKVARSRDQLPLHPLVRRVRAGPSQGRVAWHVVESGEPRGHTAADEGNGYVEDLYGEDIGFGEVGAVAEKSDRRTYYRHELVAIQALCPEMYPDVKRRAIQADVYQPSAYARYKKRLESNEFLDSDFDQEPVASDATAVVDMDVPPGFQRVMPRRQHQQSSIHGQRSSVFAGSPGSSRPPGFGAPPRFGAPPGFGAAPAINPPRYNIYDNARNGSSAPIGQQSAHHSRRSTATDPSPAPTVSQWSGEERVVDFGSLRKQTR